MLTTSTYVSAIQFLFLWFRDDMYHGSCYKTLPKIMFVFSNKVFLFERKTKRGNLQNFLEKIAWFANITYNTTTKTCNRGCV